jgi:2-keto-3-deoxy-L-rhamnonate aldolase RhmA
VLSHDCQVETKGCLEAIDDVLFVPGITCAFLGPADMGLSLGYHVHNYDLPAMLASSDMEPVYTTVVEVRGLGRGWFFVCWMRAGRCGC